MAIERISLRQELDKVRGGKSRYNFSPEKRDHLVRDLSDDIQTQARINKLAEMASYRMAKTVTSD